MRMFMLLLSVFCGCVVAENWGLISFTEKLYHSFSGYVGPTWTPGPSEKLLLDNINSKDQPEDTLANTYGLALAINQYWKSPDDMINIATAIAGAVQKQKSIVDTIALSLVEASCGTQTNSKKISEMVKVVKAKNVKGIASALSTCLETHIKSQKLTHLHIIDTVGTVLEKDFEKQMTKLFKSKNVPKDAPRAIQPTQEARAEVEKALVGVNVCEQKEGASKAAGDVTSFVSALAPTIIQRTGTALENAIKASKCSQEVKSKTIKSIQIRMNHAERFADVMSSNQVVGPFGVAYYYPKDFSKACAPGRTTRAMVSAIAAMYMDLFTELDNSCNAVQMFVE